eukprot:1180983-Amphidinium_carterae.2
MKRVLRAQRYKERKHDQKVAEDGGRVSSLGRKGAAYGRRGAAHDMKGREPQNKKGVGDQKLYHRHRPKAPKPHKMN